MATITFKAKVRSVYDLDDTPLYQYVEIPRKLGRKHCDMDAFRSHPRYRLYANSDLFPSILNGIRRDTFGDVERMRLDRVPVGVEVDTSGFLAVVTIHV